MKEFDLLKKHWNKNSDFPKISQEEIRKMIHRNSSSIVKWIFVISIMEFVILNILSYTIPVDEADFLSNNKYINYLSSALEYAYIPFSLLFIILFYRNYRLISISSSTKELMERILNTRRTVNIYIVINIIIAIISSLLVIYIVFDKYNSNSNGLTLPKLIFTVIFLIIFTSIFMGLVWLFYRVIYGFLLKKLKNNYDELRKIDY